jgi:Fe-S-cluster-containing dehydrogenase component
MRRGFAFDAALCVGCNACNAACVLENSMQPGTRSIFSWNSAALPLASVINLSMACNHCNKPVCLEGCPARAYTVDEKGVVIHHTDRCMGCRYCTWRCPYDALKINLAKGYIEKCHFCLERDADGIEPACVTACPTGALNITEQNEFVPVSMPWFPETGTEPSVVIRGVTIGNKPVIIPQETDDNVMSPPSRENKLLKEWSLLLFSLLVLSAAAIIIPSALKGTAPSLRVPPIMLAAAMLISLAHLGVPVKAWRATFNIMHSPLSREIGMVSILTLIAFINWLKPGMIHPVVQAIAALLTLISVDLVYFSADRSPLLKLHSGQAFFCGVFLASWSIAPATIFIAFSMLAAVSVVLRYRSLERDRVIRSLYYFRALSLPLVFILLYPDTRLTSTIAAILFVAGIAADRALFIDDFDPVNIKEKIQEHLYYEYEKERDKQRPDTGIP